MNHYERVQKSIDYIENNLKEELSLEEIARQSLMSISGLYRLFFAFTGHSIKDYVRMRRLSEAALKIQQNNSKIVDLALEYGFDSHEAFTRAFKRTFDLTPSELYQVKSKLSLFEHIDLMEKYFQKSYNKEYPDIRITKNLPPMNVACFKAYGSNAENCALEKLIRWSRKKGLLKKYSDHRIFGFDNQKYGDIHEYEFWITIDKSMEVEAEVTVKEIPSGKYAVMSTPLCEISQAWDYLGRWLEDSKYKKGSHQYFEEHILTEDKVNGDTRIDLYLPVEPIKTHRIIAERVEIKHKEIRFHDEMRFIGYACIHSIANANKTFDRLRKEQNFTRRINGIIDNNGSYGIFFPIHMENDIEKLGYMAALHVNNNAAVTDGLIELIAPASEYAVFNYRKEYGNKKEFFDRIYKEWLPESGYFHNANSLFSLEYYQPERYVYGEVDIWIPVRKSRRKTAIESCKGISLSEMKNHLKID